MICLFVMVVVLLLVLLVLVVLGDVCCFFVKGVVMVQLCIYGIIDIEVFVVVIVDYQCLYFGIEVVYEDIIIQDLYVWYLYDRGGLVLLDLLIFSGMDLQIKLVNDGYVLLYCLVQIVVLLVWV